MKIQSALKFLAPLAVVASTQAFAHDSVVVLPAPAEPITIDNITYKGTGCADESTAAVNISKFVQE